MFAIGCNMLETVVTSRLDRIFY